MDIITIVSIIFAFICMILGFTLEGGAINALLQHTAAIIVIGGTIGAVGISTKGKVLKRFPKIFAVAFKKRENKMVENIIFFKNLATKTRKEGLLSMEADLNESTIDPFIKKGLQMIVDGINPEIIRSSLETRLEQTSERHHQGIAMFEAAGGYAPTMGIIGTVMGLVQVLGSLDDPGELGPKIAVAFIATLYGIATANLIWLPVANKLKALNDEEITEKEMYIEALLLIQEGLSPNSIVSNLEGYLTENEIKSLQVGEEV
ncbi:flagellar motor protein [uncultured Clostridium sp.]|uniref:flagellar motor protein n=1 Tax=uncultured Clostridium sp. TaxID=59620 RepID=UPI00280B8A32|nr:flagellar motor protein [uncultured Clostridium sp.]